MFCKTRVPVDLAPLCWFSSAVVPDPVVPDRALQIRLLSSLCVVTVCLAIFDVSTEDVDVVKCNEVEHTADFFPETLVQVQGSCFVSDEMVTSSHLQRGESWSSSGSGHKRWNKSKSKAVKQSRVAGGAISGRQDCFSLSPSYPKAAVLQQRLF